jgi:hypothetical protein
MENTDNVTDSWEVLLAPYHENLLEGPQEVKLKKMCVCVWPLRLQGIGVCPSHANTLSLHHFLKTAMWVFHSSGFFSMWGDLYSNARFTHLSRFWGMICPYILWRVQDETLLLSFFFFQLLLIVYIPCWSWNWKLLNLEIFLFSLQTMYLVRAE